MQGGEVRMRNWIVSVVALLCACSKKTEREVPRQNEAAVSLADFQSLDDDGRCRTLERHVAELVGETAATCVSVLTLQEVRYDTAIRHGGAEVTFRVTDSRRYGTTEVAVATGPEALPARVANALQELRKVLERRYPELTGPEALPLRKALCQYAKDSGLVPATAGDAYVSFECAPANDSWLSGAVRFHSVDLFPMLGCNDFACLTETAVEFSFRSGGQLVVSASGGEPFGFRLPAPEVLKSLGYLP